MVTRATADKWKLKSIEDLVPHNDEVVIAGPPEFKERPVGLPGLEKNYGFVPSKFEPISDGGGPATVKALLDGKVTAANIFTTSTAIPANDLVVLEDPKNNFPAQQVVPVAAEGKLDAKAVAGHRCDFREAEHRGTDQAQRPGLRGCEGGTQAGGHRPGSPSRDCWANNAEIRPETTILECVFEFGADGLARRWDTPILTGFPHVAPPPIQEPGNPR